MYSCKTNQLEMRQIISLTFILYCTHISFFAYGQWDFVATDKVHTIRIDNDLHQDGLGLSTGDKIGFFYDSLGYARCAGWGVWEDKPTVIKVYGKTSTSEGFEENELLHIRVFSQGCVKLTEATFLDDKKTFKNGGESKLTAISYLNPSIKFPKDICFSGTYNPNIGELGLLGEVSFTAQPSGLVLDKNTGVIDLSKSAPKSYVVTVHTDLCIESYTFAVSVKRRPVSGLAKIYYICSSTPVSVSARPNLSYYRWSDGNSGNFTAYTQEGTYWLEFADASGCTAIDTFEVRAVELNIKPIEYQKLNCRVVELISPQGWAYYEWSNGERSPKAVVQEAGTYFVKLTSKEGCQHVESITLEDYLFEPQQIVFEVEPAKCDKGGNVKVQKSSLSGLMAPLSYEFANLSNGMVHRYTDENIEDLPVGVYSFVVRDALQCSSREETVQVVRNEHCGSVVITPDGDGIDDFVYISQQGLAKIYDKFGVLRNQLLIPAKWDGRDTNNSLLPTGAYLIVCNGKEDIEVTVLK